MPAPDRFPKKEKRKKKNISRGKFPAGKFAFPPAAEGGTNEKRREEKRKRRESARETEEKRVDLIARGARVDPLD